MYDKLANPFRKEEPARRAPPPKTPPTVWVRLYVMAFLLFLVVGTMIYMKKMSDAARARKDRPGTGEIDYRMGGGGGGKAPATGDEAPPAQRKDIPVAPLPQDGAVSFRDLAAPFLDGEEKPVEETPEFINLLNVFLNAVTPETLRKQVNPHLTADLAYLAPDRHRGEALRTVGRLIQIYTERVDATTPNNVEVVYIGVLQEHRTGRTVYFYLPEKPRDAATGEPIAFRSYRKRGSEFLLDWVEIEGIFLRQYTYPSQQEDERGRTLVARSAVVFAKTLRLAQKPEISDPRKSFIFIVGGLALALASVVVVAGVMSRKYGSGTLRGRLFALRRQKKARGGEAGMPPSGGGPPVPPPSGSSPGKDAPSDPA